MRCALGVNEREYRTLSRGSGAALVGSRKGFRITGLFVLIENHTARESPECPVDGSDSLEPECVRGSVMAQRDVCSENFWA